MIFTATFLSRRQFLHSGAFKFAVDSSTARSSPSRTSGIIYKDPPGEYMIVNLDEKKLKSLMKPKRVVTAEGYLTMGAEQSFIEKIDGKIYRSDGKANAQWMAAL